MPATSPKPPSRPVSIDVAAKHIGVDQRTIRRRIATGHLTGFRFGPRILRVDMAEVEAMLVPIATTEAPPLTPEQRDHPALILRPHETTIDQRSVSDTA